MSDAHVFGSAPLFDRRAQEEEEEEEEKKKKNGTTEQKHIPEIRHLKELKQDEESLLPWGENLEDLER